MPARFFAPATYTSGDLVTLSHDESQHLTRVLRLGEGAAVRIFNGRGDEFESIVESVGRDGVALRVGAARAAAPEPRLRMNLVQSVLKGDKMDDVIRDVVMMGVASVQPVVTTRTEVGLGALEKAHRRERWQRIAVSAAKQCGRAAVPDIQEARAFGYVMKALADSRDSAPVMLLVEPGAGPSVMTLADLEIEPPQAVTVVIGPEGGWTPEEIAEAADTCRLVTLGGRTLRADAMALVAISALFAKWGEL